MIKVVNNIVKSNLLSETPIDVSDNLTATPIVKAKEDSKGAVKASKVIKSKKAVIKGIKDVTSALGFDGTHCLVTELHIAMGRHDPDRPYTRLHASDVTRQELEFCPRERALLLHTKAEIPHTFISTETRTYFDVGEAYHDLVRTKWGKNVSVGDWKCLGCDTLYPVQHCPSECGTCGASSKFEYQETRVLSAATGISCGIDWQFQKKSMTKAIPVEIKSINAEDFKTLIMPLAEHTIRTRLYLHSIEHATDQSEVQHLRHDLAYILYVTKGAPTEGDYLCGSGFKESRTPFRIFSVFRDDEAIQLYLNKGVQFTEYTTTGKLPIKICPNPLSKRAASCTMCKECWNHA